MKKGVTLVELLAALVVSALVVTLATRIFLSGNKEVLRRITESEDLDRLYHLKAKMNNLLQNDIVKCANGSLTLDTPEGEKDLRQLLKSGFPLMESVEVKCLVADTAQGKVEQWKGVGQPQLVEYFIHLKQTKGKDWFSGGIFK